MWSPTSKRVLLGAAALFLLGAGLAPFLGQPLHLGHPADRYILLHLRLPRVAMGLFAGAGLAAAGVVFQAILKNPLATPYTLGVSSGAALGVVISIALSGDVVLGAAIGRPLVGMAGALVVIFATYRAARTRGRLPAQTLLLAGVALTYAFSALILAIQYGATPDDAARILRWLVGSLETGYVLGPPAFVAGAVAVALAFLLPLTGAYNALAGGEEAALGVGVDVDAVVRRSYLVTSLLVGAIVAFTGPIGFVGLLVPHALRLLGAVDNRVLLPASALAGGGFLALCDGATNYLGSRPLPVGVLTALLGGPFFLLLLLREKRRLY